MKIIFTYESDNADVTDELTPIFERLKRNITIKKFDILNNADSTKKVVIEYELKFLSHDDIHNIQMIASSIWMDLSFMSNVTVIKFELSDSKFQVAAIRPEETEQKLMPFEPDMKNPKYYYVDPNFLLNLVSEPEKIQEYIDGKIDSTYMEYQRIFLNRLQLIFSAHMSSPSAPTEPKSSLYIDLAKLLKEDPRLCEIIPKDSYSKFLLIKGENTVCLRLCKEYVGITKSVDEKIDNADAVYSVNSTIAAIIAMNATIRDDCLQGTVRSLVSEGILNNKEGCYVMTGKLKSTTAPSSNELSKAYQALAKRLYENAEQRKLAMSRMSFSNIHLIKKGEEFELEFYRYYPVVQLVEDEKKPTYAVDARFLNTLATDNDLRKRCLSGTVVSIHYENLQTDENTYCCSGKLALRRSEQVSSAPLAKIYQKLAQRLEDSKIEKTFALSFSTKNTEKSFSKIHLVEDSNGFKLNFYKRYPVIKFMRSDENSSHYAINTNFGAFLVRHDGVKQDCLSGRTVNGFYECLLVEEGRILLPGELCLEKVEQAYNMAKNPYKLFAHFVMDDEELSQQLINKEIESLVLTVNTHDNQVSVSTTMKEPSSANADIPHMG